MNNRGLAPLVIPIIMGAIMAVTALVSHEHEKEIQSIERQKFTAIAVIGEEPK